MKKWIVLFVAAASLIACGNRPKDTGTALLEGVGPQVLKLTPPSTPTTGGTGFALKTMRGVVTVTNAHICQVAEHGILMATVEGAERPVPISIIKVAEDADLCVLDGVPGLAGLEVTSRVTNRDHLYALGHPLLKALTITDGYIVARETIEIAEEEIPLDQCVGHGRSVKTVDTWLGPVTFCAQSRDAWDTSIISYPGNSGSPVVNADGEVVGVLFAGDGRTNRAAIVPTDLLVDFLKEVTAL